MIEFPKLPHAPENELIEDLSVLFNCKYFHQYNIDELRDLSRKDLGTAKQIVSNDVETSFEGKVHKTKEHEQRLKERIEQLNYQSYSDSKTKKGITIERIERLSGKISLIQVGGELSRQQ